jgi:hypothetical protein
MSRKLEFDDLGSGKNVLSIDKLIEDLKLDDNDFANPATAFIKIKKFYANDEEKINVMYSVFDAFMKKIFEYVQKFKTLMLTRYNTLSLKELMLKIRKYIVKKKIPNCVFDYFLKMVLSEQQSNENFEMYDFKKSEMNKLLGHDISRVNPPQLNFNQKDLPILQNIITLFKSKKILHQNVILQSLEHTDCSAVSVSGKYDYKKDDMYNSIHPVIAALFIPKIDYLDEHMLMGSISNIVYQRYRNKPINTKPDYELFMDLLLDPNQMACSDDMYNPMNDLLKRAVFQAELWECVKNLRNGIYYNRNNNFNDAFDSCCSLQYDTADLMFMKDEGTFLRKLLNVFSLRPTVVNIVPYIHNSFSGNYAYNQLNVSKVTTIPIINLRLPSVNFNNSIQINLSDSLRHPEWFIESGSLVHKSKEVMYSRDVVFFYVNRRHKQINFAKIVAPYSFNSLPTTISGYDTMNDRHVHADLRMSIGIQYFKLKSVVALEKSTTVNDLIIGCNALLLPENTVNNPDVVYWLYSPQTAGIKFKDTFGHIDSNEPITEIFPKSPFNPNELASETVIFNRGTIYVYVKEM